MSFGFGLGDIIACSEVAWKTINALKSAGPDFEGLRLDLASLTSVLQALEAEAKGPMPLIRTASLERQAQMRLLLRNCTESMRELQGVVGKYGSMGADKKRDFVAWMKFAAKDKRGPREKLAVHTASINIFLTTLSHGSLARLEFLIKNGSQAAQQRPVPDGTKGLDFSAAGAPWGSSHAYTKRKEGVIWQDIGRTLQDEGIVDKDIEPFQEELKAYARYLVRGETPFWREPVSSSRSHERYELTGSASSASGISNSLRREEEVKRLVLTNESKQARQAQHLVTAPRTNLDPDIKKEKIREEVYMRRREEERKKMESEKESRGTEEEDVVALAYKFESLFDFDANPTHAAPEVPTPTTEPVPATTSKDDDVRRYEQERRNARIHETQRRIAKLLDRRERYIEEGRRDKMADLELNDIPNQVKLLELESVAVSHDRAWKWDYWCDSCNFRIPGERYHCTQCRSGNWDVCRECWDMGARCSGRGQHRIILSDS